MLLLADNQLPSVAGLIAGEPVQGSWWGHPAGHAIFRAANELAERPDVLTCKLLSAKVTFVHRRVWPDVLAVACSREDWQLDGLSKEARALLEQVEKGAPVRADGKPAQDIERRLLAHATEIHTDQGSHAKALQSWGCWTAASGFSDALPGRDEARERLERLVGDLNARFGASSTLPWMRRYQRHPIARLNAPLDH